jgi:hypothetical protein
MDVPPQAYGVTGRKGNPGFTTETQRHRDTENTEKVPFLNLVFRLCELCVSVVKFLYYSRLFASIRG